MKKNHFFALFGATCLLATSCSNDEEFLLPQEPTTPKIAVVELADYLPTSTRSEVSTNEKVLKFESQEAYEETVSALQGMDDAERGEFFEKLKFDGAYVMLSKAETELEDIFDRAEETDSVTACKMIYDFMAKYEDKFQFSGEDEDGDTDVTPMLPYDEEITLIGSESGYVVIGDELIEPIINDNISSDVVKTTAASGPLYDGKLIEYKNVSVKNGKYTSYFRFGRKGSYFGFKTETYRKILFFKKHDNGCKYECNLEIWDSSNKYRFSCAIKCAKGEWKFAQCIASNYSPRVNIRVTNFSSTRNSKNKKTQTYTNILVK